MHCVIPVGQLPPWNPRWRLSHLDPPSTFTRASTSTSKNVPATSPSRIDQSLGGLAQFSRRFQSEYFTALEEGLVTTLQHAMDVLERFCAPVGPLGEQWLSEQEKKLR